MSYAEGERERKRGREWAPTLSHPATTQFRVSPTHGGRQREGEDTSEMEVARGDGNCVASEGR